MALPAFGAGQRVSLSNIGRFAGPGGLYSIIRVLPVAAGRFQYRIKSDTEPFERIVDESRIAAVSNV